MSRFAFTHSANDSRNVLTETRATIDAAIVQAELYSRTSGRAIYVVDTEKDSAGYRGVFRDGLWRWLTPCPKCKGVGNVTVFAFGSPITKACPRCAGAKVVEEEARA